jgi:radical SAM family uncharacterized protein
VSRIQVKASDLARLLEAEVLPKVVRPGRYIGSELNAVNKSRADVEVSFAIAFPDTYEIGMSNLGIQILYEIVNRLDWAVAERVFAPWVDMEERMREKSIPLYSLESLTPLKDFDIVGFSVGYELCYTNVLNMLDLGGIPLRFEERCEAGGPIVIAGGLGAFVPEPMWEFIDLFVVGEGEEAIVEILEEFRAGGFRERIGSNPHARIDFLRALATKYEGMYVPHFYRVEYDSDGTILRVEPKEEGIPGTVRKRTVKNLAAAPYPEKPIVPFIEVVQDRAVVEVMRGCGRGCRFCQAGMLYRPVRELPASEIISRAKRLIEATGFEEISLSSLSTGDHREINEVVLRLSECLGSDRTAISLPSLRPDTFSIRLLERTQPTKKTGVTLAIEAATARLRKVINKNLEEEDVLAAAEAAYAAGWRLMKLYFMIGLPTERDEDIAALAELVYKIADARKKVDGRRGHLNLSIAPFVPKAHTPFQWEKFHSTLDLQRKILYIRRLIKEKNVKLKFHDPHKSYLEAVFSRGDRRLSSAIYRAWQKGCRLDDWTEHFRYDTWLEAFRESNIDPDFYACRERAYDEVLPWDHISCGISKQSLIAERESSRQDAADEAPK